MTVHPTSFILMPLPFPNTLKYTITLDFNPLLALFSILGHPFYLIEELPNITTMITTKYSRHRIYSSLPQLSPRRHNIFYQGSLIISV